MKKADIVERLHEKVGFSKSEVDTIVESVFDIIKETLQRGDRIVISGFGKFSIRNKRTRRGRNPQTGEDLEISARRILMFKPNLILRTGLNTSEETTASDQE